MKFFTILLLLCTFPLLCRAEMNGFVDLKPFISSNYRVTDGDLNKNFTTYGLELSGEIFMTDTHRFKMMPKIQMQWGNRAHIEMQQIVIGYCFHPNENWVLIPYIGVENKNIEKNLQIEMKEFDSDYNTRHHAHFINALFGLKTIYVYSPNFSLKFDITLGSGFVEDTYHLPYEFKRLVARQLKTSAGKAEISIEAAYKHKQGSYFIFKLGTNAEVSRYNFGYANNSISAGYRIYF